jgi:hypothetical protein
MPPPKLILKFAGLLLLYWAVLLAPWPGVERGYARLFRAVGNVAFARFWFWPEGSVRFFDPEAPPKGLPSWLESRVPKAEGELDTVMAMENSRALGDVSFLRTSSRLIGFMPPAILLGLVLATPTAWKRRLVALAWGMVLVHGFILLRVTLKLAADGFSGEKAVALFHPGPFWWKIIASLRTVLHEDPTVTFVVPVFIWFVLLFRPSLWASCGKEAPSDHAAAS